MIEDFVTAFGDYEDCTDIPYLIECPVQGAAPSSVSLITNLEENPENKLEVLDIQPKDGKKKKFGVCVKHVDFRSSEFVMRFIEWVHLIRLLGAEKIHFSYRFLHPEMLKVVEYFEDQGFVEAKPYSDPQEFSNKQLAEMNTLTDCFYKVMNMYEFIAVLDFDEVIMPEKENDRTWHQLLQYLDPHKSYDAMVFQNAYFLENNTTKSSSVPKPLYMMENIQKLDYYSFEDAPKSILNTKKVLTVHNHVPIHCIGHNYSCNMIHFPINVGQLNHYRHKIDFEFDLSKTVEDKSVWKFKNQIIEKVKETLKATKMNENRK